MTGITIKYLLQSKEQHKLQHLVQTAGEHSNSILEIFSVKELLKFINTNIFIKQIVLELTRKLVQ
jgi:hypothetical protein